MKRDFSADKTLEKAVTDISELKVSGGLPPAVKRKLYYDHTILVA